MEGQGTTKAVCLDVLSGPEPFPDNKYTIESKRTEFLENLEAMLREHLPLQGKLSSVDIVVILHEVLLMVPCCVNLAINYAIAFDLLPSCVCL